MGDFGLPFLCLGSSCKLTPRVGITESQAPAWGEDTDNRSALSGKDELVSIIKLAINKFAGNVFLMASRVRDCFFCNGLSQWNMIIIFFDRMDKVVTRC